MLDWLAVGWNLAMTVSGAFLVSLSFRSWPLTAGRYTVLLRAVMSACTVTLIALYPHGLLPGSLNPHWGGNLNTPLHFDTLIYLPLIALLLGHRPRWALLTGLLTTAPGLAWSWWARGSLDGLLPMSTVLCTLLVAALLKPRLSVRELTVREALIHLPLVFLPLALPFVLSMGLLRGLLPALLLIGTNMLGFLIGMQVMRSRFKLLAVTARLSRQALTDPLTGLWNRRQLEQDLLLLPPDGHILIIDLDYFKTINDRFGHDVGDEYLISTANALNLALRTDLDQNREPVLRRVQSRTSLPHQAYRMGGEEFAVLVQYPAEARATALAQGVMAQIMEVRHRANPGGQITSSVGMARHHAGASPQATLRRADMALMQAKANGRNRLELAETLSGAATGLVHTQARPAQPLLWEAIHASLSLAALDRDLTPDDWTRLLQAAIMSVPGAESGSVNVREGEEFVLCAQIGFDDQLLDIRYAERELLDWYGLGHDAWKRGQPRGLYGREIERTSDRSKGFEFAPQQDEFRRFGKITELQASLCIPVIMDGEVVGHLNLDRLSDARPFDEEDLRVARAFADQVTVLTVAARRRAALAVQRREQVWLLDLSLGLLAFTDAPGMAQMLLGRLRTLYRLHGTLVLTAPAPATDQQPDRQPDRLATDPYALVLDWPDGSRAHLLLEGTAAFTAQEWQLLAQAAAVTNAALASLKVRAAATR